MWTEDGARGTRPRGVGKDKRMRSKSRSRSRSAIWGEGRGRSRGSEWGRAAFQTGEDWRSKSPAKDRKLHLLEPAGGQVSSWPSHHALHPCAPSMRSIHALHPCAHTHVHVFQEGYHEPHRPAARAVLVFLRRRIRAVRGSRLWKDDGGAFLGRGRRHDGTFVNGQKLLPLQLHSTPQLHVLKYMNVM